MIEKWKIGKHPSEVVSDTEVQNRYFPSPPNPSMSERKDIEMYGGYLVCESVGNNDHAKLIANAPEMMRLLKEIDSKYQESFMTHINWIEAVKIHNFLKDLQKDLQNGTK